MHFVVQRVIDDIQGDGNVVLYSVHRQREIACIGSRFLLLGNVEGEIHALVISRLDAVLSVFRRRRKGKQRVGITPRRETVRRGQGDGDVFLIEYFHIFRRVCLSRRRSERRGGHGIALHVRFRGHENLGTLVLIAHGRHRNRRRLFLVIALILQHLHRVRSRPDLRLSRRRSGRFVARARAQKKRKRQQSDNRFFIIFLLRSGPYFQGRFSSDPPSTGRFPPDKSAQPSAGLWRSSP